MATRPMMLPTLTTRPWPRSRIAGTNALVTARSPNTLVSNSWRRSRSASASSGPGRA